MKKYLARQSSKYTIILTKILCIFRFTEIKFKCKSFFFKYFNLKSLKPQNACENHDLECVWYWSTHGQKCARNIDAAGQVHSASREVEEEFLSI